MSQVQILSSRICVYLISDAVFIQRFFWIEKRCFYLTDFLRRFLVYSFITLLCLFGSVIPASVLNIFAYPISKKWSARISDYIVKVLAPRVFSILECYRNFHFFGYKENLNLLPEQFVLVSNHQSLLDIPAFMNFFREKDIRFVAKDNLSRHIPLVSEMLRSHEHCMIPRKGSPMVAMKEIESFGKKVLERKQIPIIFPEGTRTRDGNVGKFYSAGFRKLNEATKLPVVVCALDGGYSLRELGNVMTSLKNGCYRVKILKVFDSPKDKEEEERLLQEARTLIQNQLDEWRKIPSSKKY